MADTKKSSGRRFWYLIAFIGFCFTLATYFGAYFVLVRESYPPIEHIYRSGERIRAPIPAYGGGGRVAEYFFYPAHLLDRYLRPELWDYDG